MEPLISQGCKFQNLKEFQQSLITEDETGASTTVSEIDQAVRSRENLAKRD